ncbi:hypothetical protein [Serratia marcescens]|uniref:hypothetical protein n=1 Tax=Serratia marcescens TaxID=615 RepID=UPI0036D249F6
MSVFYSLDRLRSFQPGMRIDLQEASFPIVPIQGFTQQRFSSGVSRHGKIFALDAGAKVFNNASSQCEVVFELYRRAHYPNRPSRFLSMFGCETVKEAAYFRGQSKCGIDVDIFEVHSSEGFHRADMNLLNSNCPPIEMEFRADLYWSGSTAELFQGYKPFWEVVIPLPATIGEKVNE